MRKIVAGPVISPGDAESPRISEPAAGTSGQKGVCRA